MLHYPSSSQPHCQHRNCQTEALTVSSADAFTSACRNKENEELPSNTWCPCCGVLRYLLVSLALLGSAFLYITRYNLSVAIVAMVNTTHSQNVNTSLKCPAALNATSDAQTTTGGGEYNWTYQQQGFVLEIYFWGFFITRLIGGRMTEVVGPRLTAAVGFGLCGVLTLFTPAAADLGLYALAAIRLLIGMMHGPYFAAVFCVVLSWAPPGEKATMVSIAYSGATLGSVVSLGFSGMVVQAFGWRWVFWGSGIVTLVWVPFWVFFVRNSPLQHPGVSRQELSLLSENRNQPRKKVPWSRIFKSGQLYLLILMHFNFAWTQCIVLLEGPTFLTTQLGLDLKVAGTVELVATGVGWVMNLGYGWFSDLLQNKKWLQTVNIRRLMQVFGLVLGVVGFVGLVLAGCNAPLASAAYIMLGLMIPICNVTHELGAMDIAPNYAGTLQGIIGIGNIAEFLSPMFVSYFISKENGWTIIFLTCLGLYAVATIVYVIGVSASEVEWNQYEEIPDEDSPSTETIETG